MYQENSKKYLSESEKSRFASTVFWIGLTIILTIGLIGGIVSTIVVSLTTETFKTTNTITTTTTTTKSCQRRYSQTFINGLNSLGQCIAWNSFRISLNCSNYTFLRIYGSNDENGINITDLSVVTSIVKALRNSSSYVGQSNQYTWAVGECGGGLELSSAGSVCYCANGYIIRPCIGNVNWGGINGPTCNANNQTMSLDIE